MEPKHIDPAQLAAAVRALKIPTPNEKIINEILQVEGTMLVRALEGAKRGSARESHYLRGVLLACHESTIQRLQRGRLAALSTRTMVAIGKAEGPDFAMRVREWDEAGLPDGDNARYIRLTIARHLEAEAAAAEAPAQPPARGAATTAVVMPNAMHYRPGRGAPAAAAPAPSPRGDAPHGDDRPAPPEFDEDIPGRAHMGRDSGRREPAARQEQRTEHRPEPQRQDQRHEQRQQARQAEPAEASADQEYLSQHIYGGKAALCFSADQTRAKVHTVRLEAAEASATRQYDWQRKIAIQLSQRELPLVLAVFMGWINRFEGKGHGENNSKWFTIEQQGNKLYLSVNAKGQSPRGVPIMPGDGYAVTTLLMRQMLKNDPFLTPEILLSLVRKQAELFNAPAQAPAARAA
ncbi:hypothetical protein [Methylibium petroleiphilum]|nr:hypothetical protein [Methylibium petroleiphilum]